MATKLGPKISSRTDRIPTFAPQATTASDLSSSIENSSSGRRLPLSPRGTSATL